ncbi:hypothetical protein N2152v2_004283 [Parachlorella kessleri]
MGGKYAEAAHEAYRAVEETGQLFECVHAGNALVYAFLLEVRKVLQASGGGGGYGTSHQDRFPMAVKRAAEGVKTWPLRIYDAASAQEAKGVGAQIATIIVKHLFKAYPPEPPAEEELEEQRAQKAAAKQLEAQTRKRKAGQGSGKVAVGSAAEVAAAAKGPQGRVGPSAGAAAVGEDEGALQAGGGGRKRAKAAKEKVSREYIPKIGTANYAFLIVLLEAQKGPSKADFLTKAELMLRAEASGLSNKPISGEGNPAHGQGNPQNYYNGWSCFNSQLVNAHALAMTYSNPKKCALTPKGVDLAERLYRHAVDSNRLAPIPGIPSTGPFLFQLACEPAEAPEPQGHSRWEAPGSSGRPAAGGELGAVVAAAVQRPNKPTAAHQRGGGTAAVGAAARGGDMLSVPGTGIRDYPRGATELTATAQAASYQYMDPGMPWVVPARADPQTGAAAIAAALAAAGMPALRAEPASHKPGTTVAAAGAPREAAQVPVGGARITNTVAAGRLSQQTAPSQVEVVDLLDDEDDLPPLAARLAAAGIGPAGPRLQGAQADSSGAMARANRAFAGAVECSREGDVAALMDMGYSRKHAVKAMRRASNVSEAIDMLDDLSSSESESESEGGSPAFHDASETLPNEGPLGSDSVGHKPAARASGCAIPDLDQKHYGGQAAGLAPPSLDELRSQRLQSLDGQQQQEYYHQQQQQRQQQQREQPSHLLPARAAPPLGPRPAEGPLAEQRATAAAGPARGHMRLGSQQGGAGAGRYYMGSQQSTDLDGVDSDGFCSQVGLAAGPAVPLSRAGSGVALGPGGVPRPVAPAAAAVPLSRAGSGAVAAAVPVGAAQSSQQGAMGSGSIRQEAGALRLPPIPAGRTFAQEYEVVFVVDGREQYSRYNVQGRHTSLDDHIVQMQRAGLRVERRQLKIGDATWIARSTSRSQPVREYVLDYVVERKSVEDLASSIKNGDRYKRQKFWLRKCGLRNVYYLVEGDPDNLPPTEQKGVKTSAASIEVLDKFRVLRTKGHHETFRMYQALSRKIEAMYGPAQGGTPAGPSAGAGQLMTFGQWDAHMTRITKGNTTLHDVWALMLAAVPGVGPEGAMAVLQHYPTPLSLYNKYCQVLREAAARQQDGRAAAHAVLLGLRRDGYGCRPLGPEKARRVFDALFARGGWNLTPR